MSATQHGTRLISDEAPAELALQSYRLEMVRGPEPGAVWEVDEQETTIGKGPDNDVVIPDATVSRQHCVLKRTAEGFLLRDLKSTNGTFLDSARVVEAYVRPGMHLAVGEVLMLFRAVHQGVQIAPSGQSSYGPLVGTSDPMRRVFALLERVAPTDATVLIVGETGTGKGAVARAIHQGSARTGKPFVTVDCGAISRNLIESELFGHEKGAFTGAVAMRRGALEACRGGTLFLDELDDLPLDVQPKLLRALDEREIVRVGSSKPIKLDLRVVAATKKDLTSEINEGRFREDLYFRLSIVNLRLAPLRERMEDLSLLADTFLGEGGWQQLPVALRQRLLHHNFPGNVRELRNVLERTSYVQDMEGLDLAAFAIEPHGDGATNESSGLVTDYRRPFKEAKELLVERFEREYLKRLITRNDRNMARAAREAKIDRKYLYVLLGKYGLH